MPAKRTAAPAATPAINPVEMPPESSSASPVRGPVVDSAMLVTGETTAWIGCEVETAGVTIVLAGVGACARPGDPPFTTSQTAARSRSPLATVHVSANLVNSRLLPFPGLPRRPTWTFVCRTVLRAEHACQSPRAHLSIKTARGRLPSPSRSFHLIPPGLWVYVDYAGVDAGLQVREHLVAVQHRVIVRVVRVGPRRVSVRVVGCDRLAIDRYG